MCIEYATSINSVVYLYVGLYEFLDIKSNRYGKSVARRLLPAYTLLCQRVSSSYVSLVFLVLACVAMALWFSGSFHLNSSSPYLYFMLFFFLLMLSVCMLLCFNSALCVCFKDEGYFLRAW